MNGGWGCSRKRGADDEPLMTMLAPHIWGLVQVLAILLPTQFSVELPAQVPGLLHSRVGDPDRVLGSWLCPKPVPAVGPFEE